MALSITTEPKQTVSGSHISRWNSINHPIRFGITRGIDFTFTSITTNSTSTATVSASGFGAAFYDTFTPGTDFQIYISGSDIPEGLYTVTSDILIGSNSFIIDITGMGLHPDNFTGGDLKIIRTNYRVKAEIYANGTLVSTAATKLDSNDTCTIDVAEYLKSVITYDETNLFNATQFKDETLSGSFYIKLSENWTSYTGEFGSASDTFFYINSVKQLGEVFGSNMGHYIPFLNSGTLYNGRFLSDFETPTYFVGYPFSIDFIFDENMNSVLSAIRKAEENFNINNGSGGTTYTLLTKEVDAICRLKLLENYTSTDDHLDVWLDSQISG